MNLSRLVIGILFLILAHSHPSFSQEEEISTEDLGIIEVLDILENLDILDEDLELLENLDEFGDNYEE